MSEEHKIAAKVKVSPKTKDVPKVKAASKAKAAPKVKAAPKAKAEPKVKAAPKAKAEPRVKAAPKAKAEPKPKAAPKAKAEPKPKAAPKAKAEPKAKAAPKAKAEPKAKTTPKAKAEPKAKVVAEVPAEPQLKAKNKRGPVSGRDLADIVAAAAAEHKPIDPILLDLSGLSSIADWFFVASAASPRQMVAIAEKIIRRAREHGVRPLGQEGFRKGGGTAANDLWVLVDLGDVVVHIFNLEGREMYDLEGLWTEAPRRPVTG